MSRPTNRQGLSLVEVVVSTLLVGLLLTASLVSVGAAARNSWATTESLDVAYLAQQLLEEIVILPFSDPNQTPVFGSEVGEGIGNRQEKDDIDDFSQWTESPPRESDGNIMLNYAGWTRTVKVLQGPNTSTDLNIEVTVVAPSGRSKKLTAYRSKDGGSLQPQGVDQTLVTWIGVTLQTGTAAGVSSGVSLVNHATDQ